MTHDEIAEIAFEVIRICHERGITDPLRLAHAIAVALKTAEPEGQAADLYGCPDTVHYGVDCPGDRCRHAATTVTAPAVLPA